MTPEPRASRLARERERLFGMDDPRGAHVPGPVRLLLLELARPAAWAPLAALWHTTQIEWGLPAAAIALNGRDGLQLWWGLTEPVPSADGLAWLDALRRRFLPDVVDARVTLQAWAGPPALPQCVVPPDQWSAFVAPDLAPLFEETPWIDLPPTEDGQADLLARLRPIEPATWRATWQALCAHPEETAAATDAPASADLAPVVTGRGAAPHVEAERFLLRMLRDETAPLALRVEAAKALLPYGTRR